MCAKNTMISSQCSVKALHLRMAKSVDFPDLWLGQKQPVLVAKEAVEKP